jgi:CRISPR/Cas system-associated exonuclease Cas4 (RecB family)
MIYSYTQISQYLRCPRSYRYRYLDGWREKDTRAAMVFGRCFEKALAAYFQHQDCTAALFKEWGAFRDTAFVYRKGAHISAIHSTLTPMKSSSHPPSWV